jgi:hypothetical protein
MQVNKSYFLFTTYLLLSLLVDGVFIWLCVNGLGRINGSFDFIELYSIPELLLSLIMTLIILVSRLTSFFFKIWFSAYFKKTTNPKQNEYLHDTETTILDFEPESNQVLTPMIFKLIRFNRDMGLIAAILLCLNVELVKTSLVAINSDFILYYFALCAVYGITEWRFYKEAPKRL